MKHTTHPLRNHLHLGVDVCFVLIALKRQTFQRWQTAMVSECARLECRSYSPRVIIDHLPEIVYLSWRTQFSYKFYVLSIILGYEYDTFAVAGTAGAAVAWCHSRKTTSTAFALVRIHTIKRAFAHGHMRSLVCIAAVQWCGTSAPRTGALSACNWSCLSLPCDLYDGSQCAFHEMTSLFSKS